MQVALGGGAHDHLGGLARRGEAGRVAVLGQLLPGEADAVPNLSHGGQNGGAGLVRGQPVQALFAGQLDVYRKAVGQQAQTIGQQRVGPRNGLGVDISGKAIFLPQNAQGFHHPLGGAVGVAAYRGGEEKPFDVVAAIKLDGELGQLPGGKRRPGYVVGAAVHAVLAVVGTYIGHQDFEEGDAPAVGGKGVAAARQRGRTQLSRPPGPVQPAGGAGGVVLGRIGQNGQLIQQFHRGSSLQIRTGVRLLYIEHTCWSRDSFWEKPCNEQEKVGASGNELDAPTACRKVLAAFAPVPKPAGQAQKYPWGTGADPVRSAFPGGTR